MPWKMSFHDVWSCARVRESLLMCVFECAHLHNLRQCDLTQRYTTGRYDFTPVELDWLPFPLSISSIRRKGSETNQRYFTQWLAPTHGLVFEISNFVALSIVHVFPYPPVVNPPPLPGTLLAVFLWFLQPVTVRLIPTVWTYCLSSGKYPLMTVHSSALRNLCLSFNFCPYRSIFARACMCSYDSQLVEQIEWTKKIETDCRPTSFNTSIIIPPPHTHTYIHISFRNHTARKQS